MTPERLQYLVDEHARLGMSNAVIKKHLRESHDDGTLAQTVIPVPTQKASKERDDLLCGRIAAPKTSMGDVFVVPAGQIFMHDADEGGSSESHLHTPNFLEEGSANSRVRVFPSAGSVREAGEQLMREFPGITMTSYDGLQEDRLERYMRDIYISSGQTLLDRLINGIGADMASYRQDPTDHTDQPLSYFERVLELVICRDEIDELSKGKVSDENQKRHDFLRDLSIAVFPWFPDDSLTANASIDSTMAEIFLGTKLPADEVWRKTMASKPFFLDIKAPKQGQRYISGIFCTPSPDGGFKFMACMEWSQQGYEAFLFGDTASGRFDKITVANIDPDAPNDAYEQLYQESFEKIKKLAIMGALHVANLERIAGGRGEMPTLKAFTHIEDLYSSKAKKLASKLKTHSYFRVINVKTPADQFGRTRQNSWSLDHMVPVSGHFRWQPHGAGRTQHKLIWIDAHVRGEDLPKVRPLSNPVLMEHGVGNHTLH